MNTINPTTHLDLDPLQEDGVVAVPKRKNEHLNWMGGLSFDITNPLTKLQIAASSCFFGEPMYYHREQKKNKNYKTFNRSYLSDTQLSYLRETLNAMDPKEWRDLSPDALMVDAIDKALDFNAEATLDFAVKLRRELKFRVTPQVIMVRAALHPKVKGTNLISSRAPLVLKRLDEVCTQYAYYLSLGRGHTPPKNLKRAWAGRIESASGYELAKYRLEGHDVNLFDVVNISRPRGGDRNPSIDLLMKGQLKLGEDHQTWESIRSSGGSWIDASEVMGHMALLRNLRNLEQNAALSDALLEKLKNGVRGGEQLPFRYYSAYRALQDAGAGPKVLDAVSQCLEIALENLPAFKGRTMCLVDNSGSAHGTLTSSMGSVTVSTIGNLMGVITGKISDEGYVGVFGDKLDVLPVTKTSSTFDLLDKVEQRGKNIGGGTENGIWLFFDNALKKKEHWDNIFVYSDMQAGHGGLYGKNSNEYKDFVWNSRYIDVAKLISEYRKKVNANVNVVLVQTAGYQDSLVPEFYDRTYILGGWSERIIEFAHNMISMREIEQ